MDGGAITNKPNQTCKTLSTVFLNQLWMEQWIVSEEEAEEEDEKVLCCHPYSLHPPQTINIIIFTISIISITNISLISECKQGLYIIFVSRDGKIKISGSIVAAIM